MEAIHSAMTVSAEGPVPAARPRRPSRFERDVSAWWVAVIPAAMGGTLAVVWWVHVLVHAR